MVWLLEEDEMTKVEEAYFRGRYKEIVTLEDMSPVMAKAALRKVALVFKEHGAVSARRNIPDSDWTVSLPLGMVKSLFEEAGLVPEGVDAKSD